MVRFVFRANLPMKIGGALIPVAVIVFLVGAVVGDESSVYRVIAIGILIVAAVVYFAGRLKQLMAQRPR